MTLLDEPVAPDVVRDASALDRVLELLADAGLTVTPALGAQMGHMRLDGKRYLVIDDDEIYTVDSEYAVLGAVLDAEGMLRIVCMGATR